MVVNRLERGKLQPTCKLVCMIDVFPTEFIQLGKVFDDRLETGSDIGLVIGTDWFYHR